METLADRLGLEIDIDYTIKVFGLILARMLGAIVLIPFLGGPLVPPRLKFGIAFTLVVFIFPFASAGVEKAELPPGWATYIIHFLFQVLIGLSIGFVVAVPFWAMETAGQFMDTARGTTFAQVVAPFMQGMTSILGQLWLLMFMLVLFSIDGHHMILGALGRSYLVMPITRGAAIDLAEGEPFLMRVIDLSAEVFVIGLTMSAPLLVCMIVIDVMLGVVNRVAPQINVYWMGMPLKAIGGLFIVFLVLTAVLELMGAGVVATVYKVETSIDLLGK